MPTPTVQLGVLADFTIAGRTSSLILDIESSDDGYSFSGGTESGQNLPISALIKDLTQRYGENVVLPEMLSGLTIDQLSISYSSTGAFSFICSSKLIINGQILDIQVKFQIQKQNKGYSIALSGQLSLAGLEFKLHLESKQDSRSLIASYSDKTNQGIKLKDLVNCVSAELGTYIPDSFELSLKNVVFVYHQPAAQKDQNLGKDQPSQSGQFLFGIQIDTHVGLADLPLIGKKLPPEFTIVLEGVQLLIASRSLDSQFISSLRAYPEISPLLGSMTTLPAGVNLTARMKFGTEQFLPCLPLLSGDAIGDRPAQPNLATTSAKPPALPTTEDGRFSFDSKQFILWYKIQKAIGPVVFKRIGVQYKEEKIWFFPDIGLASSSLKIDLEGLAVGFKIQPLFSDSFKFSELESYKKLELEFRLRGIGIHYKSAGGVEIGGAFLRTLTDVKDKAGTVIATREEYSGAAMIRTKAFSLSAIGSYTELNGHPSIFVYAFLDQAIGGPAFFFVTGLAAGFGYNRDLIMPSLDEIPQFPLVKLVMGGDSSSDPEDSGILGILSSLQTYIPPAAGKYFLAIGIKFTSFKLIDSFALLLVTFGDRFQVRLLGFSKIVVPPSFTGMTPIAEIQIGLKAEFVPDEGCLKVDGKILPGSYLFSRDCQLSGGFAFYTWFTGEHAGDFVLTMGGYHPKFKVPDHYPKVDRLALNWQINQHLSIKGEAYFALTSSAIMAGGNFEARFQAGDLSASFRYSADFLMAWQPYYYDIKLSAEIQATYCTTLKDFHVSVSAELHLWGPEFSGKAYIDLEVISFEISFGQSSQSKPDAIDWKTFQSAFLPDRSDICRVSAGDGLIKTLPEAGAKRWVINPKDFQLTTESAIPIKEVSFNSSSVPLKTEKQFGISSMDIQADKLESNYWIEIRRGDQPCEPEDFQLEPITKNIPSALWGESIEPDLNGKLIPNVLTGFHIKPGQQPKAGKTSEIDCSRLEVKLEQHRQPDYCKASATTNQTNTDVEALLQALGQQFNLSPDQIQVASDSALLQDFSVDLLKTKPNL